MAFLAPAVNGLGSAMSPFGQALNPIGSPIASGMTSLSSGLNSLLGGGSQAFPLGGQMGANMPSAFPLGGQMSSGLSLPTAPRNIGGSKDIGNAMPWLSNKKDMPWLEEGTSLLGAGSLDPFQDQSKSLFGNLKKNASKLDWGKYLPQEQATQGQNMPMGGPQQTAPVGQQAQGGQSLYDFMNAYNQAAGSENGALTLDQLLSMFDTSIK